MAKIVLRYATQSLYKKEEISFILKGYELADRRGRQVVADDLFEIKFSAVSTDEPLERDLVKMVEAKAVSAYKRILSPCIVEHAGLIITEYADQSYPGGLTQPMWDALGADGFIKSSQWSSGSVVARAVVGYCDGLTVRTFVGETVGTLAPSPIGDRKFYWDTIFAPSEGDGSTYAQISERDGLAAKVKISQSRKALLSCLQHVLKEDSPIFPRY